MVINFLTKGWQFFSYDKRLLISIVFIFAGALTYSAYYYASLSREKYAYKAFAESHDLFEQAVAADDGKDKGKALQLWKDVEISFQDGFSQNKKSELAPYFLAFQAEARVRQGDLKGAIEVMDHMMRLIKNDSELYGLYAVKRSLMKLDMPDTTVQQVGLEELIKLANEEMNLTRDMALYYLGEYYWAHNEPEKARVSWKYLQDMANFGKSPTPSPWFDLVKARVESV